MTPKFQSKKSSSNHPIDGMIKKHVDLLNFTAPQLRTWTRSKSWEVIKEKIGEADSKVIAWGMALAATISLTVAAGLQLNISHLNEGQLDQKKEMVSLKPVEPIETSNFMPSEIVPVAAIKLSTTNAQNTPPPASKTVSTFLSEYQYSPIYASTIQSSEVKFSKIIHPYFSLGITPQNLKPEIGIDFLIYSIENNFKTNRVKLGLSTEFVQNNTSELTTRVNSYHFANLTYESINSKNNKGWSARTGMLINPDSNFYTNTTMKLGIRRQFNKWLRFGPEIIFTNNLKKIYPSLTLSLG